MWFRTVFGALSLRTPARRGRHAPCGRPRPAPFRPRLEALEDRWVPSTLTVTNILDTGVLGDGSLRGEIAAAQNGDVINFAPGLAGQTITLTGGELAITNSLDIQGLGANQLTVSGNSASRVFDITGSTTNVQIHDLTIANGVDSSGGAIYNAAVLTVSNCTLSNNSAIGYFGGYGGAIYNNGELTYPSRS